MKVHELIAALSKQDPDASAFVAMRAVRAEASAAEALHAVTPAGIRECHARELDHAKIHADCKGNTNADPIACAFHSTRSEVFAALQATNPAPGPHPDDDGDPEMHHMRQKAHNKRLWKETDALVAAAGVTAKGMVS